jgi:hypothetical protein
MSREFDAFALHLFLENYIADNIGNYNIVSITRFRNHLNNRADTFKKWIDAANVGIGIVEKFDLELDKNEPISRQTIDQFARAELESLSANTLVLIIGGVLVPGVTGAHAVCWLFDFAKKRIWFANSGNGLENHQKIEDDLWNTVRIWQMNDDPFLEQCVIILRASLEDKLGFASSNKTTQELYDNVVNPLDQNDVYQIPGENKSGILGQFRWKVVNGIFYSEQQITGTCTFHSILWILYVNMDMEHDLVDMFRKQELAEINEHAMDYCSFAQTRNCMRLIYSLYSSLVDVSNIKNFLLYNNKTIPEKQASQINPVPVHKLEPKQTCTLSKTLDASHIETLTNYIKNYTTIEQGQLNTASTPYIGIIRMLNKHTINVSIETMRKVTEESIIDSTEILQQDWIAILKNMTDVLILSTDAWYAPGQKINNVVGQQNFFAVRERLVVRMFQINEQHVPDWKLPRCVTANKVWPCSYKGRWIEIGSAELLNEYYGYLLDTTNALKTYDVDIQKKDTKEIIELFWEVDFTHLPAYLKGFYEFIGTNEVTVFLMTAFTLLLLPQDDSGGDWNTRTRSKIYLNKKNEFRFNNNKVNWNFQCLSKCDNGLDQEVRRFFNLQLSTDLIQGKWTLDDKITTTEEFLEFSGILFDTCGDKDDNVIISQNWYINYKTKGRWLEKQENIELDVYMKLLPLIETCNIFAFLFYIVKMLQYYLLLSAEFKKLLGKVIASRTDLMNDLQRVMSALLSEEPLLLGEFINYFEQQKDPQMMVLQSGVLVYLDYCSDENYTKSFELLTFHAENLWNVEPRYKFSHNHLIHFNLRDDHIYRKSDDAVLIFRPDGTKLGEIGTMLHIAQIQHLFLHANGVTFLDIPDLLYCFKCQDNEIIMTHKNTKETWVVKWEHEVPCSARDWGYKVYKKTASFFIENAKKELGVIFMHSPTSRLEMAKTYFDRDPSIDYAINLTGNSVYLQFADNLCMPIFPEASLVYFIGAVCIAGGNIRCIQALFERLRYANKTPDMYETFVAVAIEKKCLGTPFFPLFVNNTDDIKRRRFEQVSIESSQNIVEIPAENPIDHLLTVTKNDTPYPTLSIENLSFGKTHLDAYKNALSDNLKHLDEKTFATHVDFYPSCKVAWLVSVIRASEKASLIQSERERFSLVKHLHNYWVKPPSKENEFEAISGKFVTYKQQQMIEQMEQKIWTEKTSNIHQAIMGIGKSNVIMPLLVSRALSENFNVIVLQPPHLVKAASHILFSFLPYSTHKKVQIIFEFVDASAHERWVAVLSDKELKKKVLFARALETQLIIDHVHSAVILMDEIDEMSNPLRSELNITIGNSVAHPTNISSMSDYYSKIYLASIEDQQEKLFDLGSTLNTKIALDVKHCIELRYNMDYGKPITGTFAVPYKGVDSPIFEASFSDPEIKHILTCMTKYKSGLGLEDIRIFRKTMSAYSYMGTEVMDEYLGHISSIFNDVKNPFAFVLMNSSRTVLEKLKMDKNIIKYYVINILLPASIFQTTQYNIAFMDLIESGTCKMKIGFSGTTNMLSPPFDKEWDFQPCIIQSDDANAQIGFTVDKNLLKINDLLEFFNSHDVVVDEAGLLRTYHIQDIKNKTNKTLVYFDDQDQVKEISQQRKVYFFDTQSLTANKIIVDPKITQEEFLKLFEQYDVVIDEQNAFAQVPNETIRTHTKKTVVFQGEQEQKVYYFDQKHTTGTDLNLPSLAKGVVFIDLKLSILSKVAQAAFRLRNVNMGQTVEYAAIDSLKNGANLFDHLRENEINQITPKKTKHWIHAIRTQYRKEKHYIPFAYQMKIQYSSIDLPEITDHQEWIGFVGDSGNAASVFDIEHKIEQKQEHSIQTKTSDENWSYSLTEPVIVEAYTQSVILSTKFDKCYSTLKSILLSPFVLKMLSLDLSVPRYILLFVANNQEYCRLITPGEALALPSSYCILNNQGISINNVDTYKRTDIVLIAMILCGYSCPLHEQIRVCFKLETDQVRENVKCIISEIFINKDIELTHILYKYIYTDQSFDKIMNDLRAATESDETFGIYIFGLSHAITSISNYRHRIIKILSGHLEGPIMPASPDPLGMLQYTPSKLPEAVPCPIPEPPFKTSPPAPIKPLPTPSKLPKPSPPLSDPITPLVQPSSSQSTKPVLTPHLQSGMQDLSLPTAPTKNDLIKYAIGAGGLISLMTLANALKKKKKSKSRNKKKRNTS